MRIPYLLFKLLKTILLGNIKVAIANYKLNKHSKMFIKQG